MKDYPSNIQDEVRRAYLQMGPCRPTKYEFPYTLHAKKKRRFVVSWFEEYDWLEYSISKDAAFCLHCYLFKINFSQLGSDAFTRVGFKNGRMQENVLTNMLVLLVVFTIKLEKRLVI